MAVPPSEDQSHEEIIDRLLGPLRVHFLAAAQAYADYVENGRTYLFACNLRRTNASARALLLTWGHLLPAGHMNDVLSLLRHYDVWLTLWDDHAAHVEPSIMAPFVFEYAVTFPTAAQQRLMKLYEELEEALARAST